MTEPFTVIDENMKLQIHLHNDKPVELSTLCQSLDGISKRIFTLYPKRHARAKFTTL
ncbi:hypothetical protein Q7329_09305 [Glaesserella parasuis]|nr:hypothetical protein [Glaesserella parasuis]MDO9997064.1 hypothetical protein [Glaesserella parasuis]MDP0013895.1 hypothetical protein [Glaesserella parasuis]MDP0045777.1 hypothetical protein [Glaesserella parasuis]MDP0137247.1 hypothetical protein [Glaesserella parasuis]